MKKISETIIFFGSGPVAAQSLGLLLEHFEIEAVITKPTTVRDMASVKKDLRIYSVDTKQELDSLMSTKQFSSKLAILIDFGIIISNTVINHFSFGVINSHFSVLPQWRGADPISFAILSGQKTTGVSLMLLNQGMDTGKILVTRSLPIAKNETSPSLTDKLIVLSNELLAEYIPRYINKDIKPRLQSHPDRATYSRKLVKEDGLIDWAKPAVQIEREIRAFIEWPKSRTILANKDVIVMQAHVTPGNSTDNKPGEVETSVVSDGILMIETGNGRLCVDRLKPAGKKEMSASEFIRGYGQKL